ncbi:MAG: hypothetical protein RR284_06380, partial [Ruthenibacterium sp.]
MKNTNTAPKDHKMMTIVIGIIVAFIAFVTLTVIQSSILNQENKVEALQLTTDVQSGTKITEQNVDLLFHPARVSESLVPSNYVSSKSSLLGKFVSKDYVAKDILTKEGVSDIQANYAASIENPVEIAFSLGDLGEVVGGIVREGDFVNIYGLEQVTTKGDGKDTDESIKISKDYTFQHIYVTKAFSSDGVRVLSDASAVTPTTLFNIILSDADAKIFSEMVQNCILRVAKILPGENYTESEFAENANENTGLVEEKPVTLPAELPDDISAARAEDAANMDASDTTATEP